MQGAKYLRLNAEMSQTVAATTNPTARPNVKVTLEIHAEVQDGVPERTVRTVTENCRTLKFVTVPEIVPQVCRYCAPRRTTTVFKI